MTTTYHLTLLWKPRWVNWALWLGFQKAGILMPVRGRTVICIYEKELDSKLIQVIWRIQSLAVVRMGSLVFLLAVSIDCSQLTEPPVRSLSVALFILQQRIFLKWNHLHTLNLTSCIATGTRKPSAFNELPY